MRVHISLNVESLDRSLAFYTSLFGQDASKRKAGYANFRLDEPPIHLALEERSADGASGVSHLGIEVPDANALQSWRARLQDAGVVFAVEDEARCCYARADKLWLTDPDGFNWEIWVHTGDFDGMGETRVTTTGKSVQEEAC